METRYDEYYEREIPYKMTLEELKGLDHPKEEDILAYFRHVGINNVRVIVPATPQSGITITPFPGIAMCSGERVATLCRMVDEDEPLYNPLVERDYLRPEHWYHPYKIKFTPVEFEGVTERFYFSDFCSI